MKSKYRVYWRFYGSTSESSEIVAAYSKYEAQGIVANSNHMIQVVRAELI